MRMNLLTVRKVKQLRRTPGKYPDGAGLFLDVTEGGASWLFRYTLNRRTRDMGLGPADLVSLAEARDARHEYRRLLKRGSDPIEHRRAKLIQDAVNAITFERCSRDYIEIHRDEWDPRHAARWEHSLRDYAFPTIGHVPVGSINVDHVVAVLSPIWRVFPVTAKRLRGRIQVILDYAAACGYRSNRDGNPADWNGPLHLRLADLDKIRKPKHYPAVPFDRIPEFMAALREEKGDKARALEYLILNAARPDEVIGGKEDQIHGDLWTIPAEEMKVDERTADPRYEESEDCTRPLSDAAQAIVAHMRKIHSGSEYLFPGDVDGHLPEHALRPELSKVLGRIGFPHATPHGFRSAFFTWGQKCTTFPEALLNMMLAHAVEGSVKRAYLRGDGLRQFRELAQAWADYCGGGALAPGKWLPKVTYD